MIEKLKSLHEHNLRIFSREEEPDDLLKNIRLGGNGKQRQNQDTFADPRINEIISPLNRDRGSSRGGREETK